MHSNFRSAQIYHREYVRRHQRLTEPAEQSANGLREAIGHRLIHLGERLARVERRPTFDRAA